MGCCVDVCSCLTKYSLFVMNIVFALCGIGFIVGGAFLNIYWTDEDEIWRGEFFWIAVTVIVVGCLIFLISFCGCCGAIIKNRFLLITYAILIQFILFVEMAVCAFVITQVFDDNAFNFSLKNNFMKFFQREYADHSSRRFDSLQYDWECCGVDGAQDYSNIFVDGSVPLSCCPWWIQPEFCNPELAYKTGCYEELVKRVHFYIWTSSWGLLAAAFVQILTTFAAFSLVIHFKKQTCKKCKNPGAFDLERQHTPVEVNSVVNVDEEDTTTEEKKKKIAWWQKWQMVKVKNEGKEDESVVTWRLNKSKGDDLETASPSVDKEKKETTFWNQWKLVKVADAKPSEEDKDKKISSDNGETSRTDDNDLPEHV